jgi:glutamate/tyrosine decarboxylase-like PLP-dependent enzyme
MAAGVPLPEVPGGFASLTLANFDGVVAALEALAEFANWDHTGDKPDLPGGYAASPSLSSAAAALGFGIETLEIIHNLQLKRTSRKRVVLTATIFKKLDGRAQDLDQLCKKTCFETCCRATASG